MFEKHINEAGYEVTYGHLLAKLVREEGGRVTGAIFETENGYVHVNAKKAVLLTTGGYSANPDMLRALSPVTTQSVTALGYNQNNKGMGIKAAMWAGAAKDLTSATMIFDRGLVAPGTPAGYTEESIEAGDPQFPGNGQFNPGTQPFLKVNMAGERFANESADYDYLPHAAAQQPSGTYISVWDGNFGEDCERFHTLGCSAGTRNGVLAFKKDDGSYDLDAYFRKSSPTAVCRRPIRLTSWPTSWALMPMRKRRSSPRVSAITSCSTLRKTPTSSRRRTVFPSCAPLRSSAPRSAVRF